MNTSASYLEQYDATADAEKFPLVRRWMDTEPLPFVPAMWMHFNFCCGLSNASHKARIVRRRSTLLCLCKEPMFSEV